MVTGAPIVIPTLAESLDRVRRIPDDIRLIQEKTGMGLTQMARSFGVSKPSMWGWREGLHTPREPLAVLSITLWADDLRETSAS